MNTDIFNTKTKIVTNNAGGNAFSFDAKHCLSQIAVTNCFNGTFYASSNKNLELAKKAALTLKDDPEFIAKVAVYARKKSHMKDMPAFLVAILSEINTSLFRKIFPLVVDNGKMLRNVIQIARCGILGKKANISAGTWRRAIQQWFNDHNEDDIFRAIVGNNPTLSDILKMSHPKPNSPQKESLFGYIVGRDIELNKLPEKVRLFEEFKKNPLSKIPPDVDFRLLDSLNLGQREWCVIAENAPWHMTRMNLATFARHGVFDNEKIVSIIANRLKNREIIEKSRVFPYQLFAAWKTIKDNKDIPDAVSKALHEAFEISLSNVPEINGNGLLCVDASGSMGCPITGFQRNNSSSITCADVAGLIASAVVRKNPNSQVWTFSDQAVPVEINPKDSVLFNIEKLNNAGGGTDISAPMIKFNAMGIKSDWVLYVSDYESWLDFSNDYYGETCLSKEWNKFKINNPNAKLICCDLTPRDNSQMPCNKEVLQVGGFSDHVFDVIADFCNKNLASDAWVSEINAIEL